MMAWLDSLNGGALVAYLILATVVLTALVALLMHLASWSAARALVWLARWQSRITLKDGEIRYGEPSPTVWPLVVVGAFAGLVVMIVWNCGGVR